MWKIQFGCGGNQLDGWENYDRDIDISKPIPRDSDLYDFIFAEHVLEHVDSPSAYGFLEECYRILKTGGVLRIAVPGIDRIKTASDSAYLSWLEENKYGDGTVSSAIKNIVTGHEHYSSWTYELLDIFLEAVGFDTRDRREVGKSPHSELTNIEGHGKVIGDHNNWVETLVIEATK